MKHFDEDGNFVNTPEPEEEIVDEIVPLQVNYIFKEVENSDNKSSLQ